MIMNPFMPNPVARGGWPGGRPGVAAGSGGAQGTISHAGGHGRRILLHGGGGGWGGWAWWPWYPSPWVYQYTLLGADVDALRRRVLDLEEQVARLRRR